MKIVSTSINKDAYIEMFPFIYNEIMNTNAIIKMCAQRRYTRLDVCENYTVVLLRQRS